MRRLALAGLLAAVVAVPASAQESPTATTVAAFRGSVLAVAQDARSIAWLQWSPDGCFLRIHARNAKTTRSVRYARACNQLFHDLVFDRGRAIWAGDEEVICGKTYAAVYVYTGGRPRLVQKLPRDCLGFGPSLRGVVGDGHAFYYNVFKTARPPAASQCGDLGGLCEWKLGGGQIYRMDATKPVPLRGLPPTVMFAVDSGRVILVQPLKEFAAGSSAGWPRPVRNGRVEVRDLATGRVESSFHPQGLVRSVALTQKTALVLVEYNGLRTVESYDVHSGRHLRSLSAPVSLRRLPLTGSQVAFPLNDQVSVFDVSTGKRWVAARTRFNQIGLSIRDGWVAWGENDNKFARILVARGS